jgi:Putative beta-lactamase-inhibitor-like, PepSY-like
MKKIFSLVLLCICMVASVNAQKINVPAAVSSAFKSKFPEAAEVKWGKENAKEYEAEFKLGTAKVSANFAPDGSWMETEIAMAVTELPAAVSGAINAKYAGAVITAADKIEKPGSKVFYEADVKVNNKRKEVILNEDGTFIK